MIEPKTLAQADLGQFTGSEHWYRHGINRRVLFTDGAKHVADAGGAYWLLDAIAIAQNERRVATEAFQLWTLKVAADRSATLTCEDGNGKAVFTQRIPFTDFPLEEVSLYVTDSAILLPSEY